MRFLVHQLARGKSQYKKIFRSYLVVGLFLVSAVAFMACGAAATPAPTTPPTQPTTTPTEEPTPTPQLVEEPAPVESVAIEVISTDPVTAEMVLVTGLPSGCVSFKGYTIEREGDTFRVTATNVRPDQDDLVCTMIYGMETTRIPLTGDIEVCETYTVVVNDESFSVQAKVPGEECETDGAMREEPAPIESVAIEAEATDPVQANLIVVSGLPNACYSFGHYDISREGDTFQVEVINTVPDDPNLACAEIYRTVTTEVPLEGEIELCKTYTVVISGESHEVQAIAPNVRCSDPSTGDWTEVALGMGERVTVGDEGLAVTFLEVTEDSRCPSDAVCIQAGQATITIKVEMSGSELGTLSLSLGPAVDMAPETLGGYSFQLARLDPYPVSTVQIQPEDYVAYVAITKTEG